MSPSSANRWWLRVVGLIAAGTAGAMAAVPAPVTQDKDPAAALRAQYATLTQRLEQSPFQQHLAIESVEGPHELRGDVYAVVDYPVATVSSALTSPAHWCDTLILHLNVKYCRAGVRGGRTVLSVAIGSKRDQPLPNTYRLEFVYGVAAAGPDYMAVELNAREGPLGTHDYRIAFEAVGLDRGHTFVHLRYSYSVEFESRLAMQVYLSGTGRGKVGFTMSGDPADRRSTFIGGVRGVLERNIMRYYLAIDAYLGALAAPVPRRFEESIERWFDATEQYARQLHEVDRDTYLAMKRREYARQQAVE
jgi:hypothetical protein